MFATNLRWKYVVLWSVLALIILVSGNYCFEVLTVKRPLEQKLAQMPNVSNVHISFGQSSTVMTVTLTHVADVQRVYSSIDEQAQKILGNRNYEIKLADHSTKILDDAYESIHYYVEEARVRGNFGQMAERCISMLEDSKINDFKLTVDDKNIYVQMSLGDKYLYRIIKLDSFKGGAES